MLSEMKSILLAVGAFAGASLVCPLREVDTAPAFTESVATVVQASDTATMRLHISGMT